MLKSDLCDFRDACIVVKGTITLAKTDGRGFIDIRNRFLSFKNNAPFANCIPKIKNALLDNAEDLDVAKPICLSAVKNIKKQQEVREIITRMSLIILLLMMMTLLLLVIMQIL